MVALPWAWRDRDGWSLWRKARHGLMVLSFVLFAVALGAWSALVPWNV
jgi:hypothetical protein